MTTQQKNAAIPANKQISISGRSRTIIHLKIAHLLACKLRIFRQIIVRPRLKYENLTSLKPLEEIAEKNASLVLVGSGIKSISHLTVEAKAYITQSEKVLYLVNEPILQEWIEKQNPNAESLDDIYFKFPMRIDCYRAITDYILETLKKPCHLCVVIYGHPCVFAQPGLEAIKQARKAGFDTQILPGISADACLYADLMINPADCGSQSFEATDFLIYRRPFSTTSHLILWQIGSIAQLGHVKESESTKGLRVLVDHLCKSYHSSHQVTVYEASQYPHLPPSISTCRLDALINTSVTRLSTLYIPPNKKMSRDESMLKTLELRSNMKNVSLQAKTTGKEKS